MSMTVEIEELRVGMFVHLDLGWWAHPFALSSFLVTTPEQLATIRGLGLKKLRWSPEKSRLSDAAVPAAPGRCWAGMTRRNRRSINYWRKWMGSTARLPW